MALSSLLQWFPHAMQPHVMDLVTPVWNIFLTSTPLYPQPPIVCVHVARLWPGVVFLSLRQVCAECGEL